VDIITGGGEGGPDKGVGKGPENGPEKDRATFREIGDLLKGKGEGPEAPGAQGAPPQCGAVGASLDRLSEGEREWTDEEVRQALKKLDVGQPIMLEPFVKKARSFIERLRDGEGLYLVAYDKKAAGYDIIAHSLNVCILSLRVGIGTGLDDEGLGRLGTAAMLHDLGMAKVPEEIFLKPGTLDHSERAVMQAHPAVAYKAISEARDAKPRVADVAYSVHERCSGRGYPRGLAAQEIPELAKLMGLVDMYEALIHPRPFRGSFLPIDAFREIIDTGRDCFPHKVFKALLDHLTAFPLGCYVKLNSGEIGRVVDTNKFAPMRPKVMMLFSPSGKRMKEQRVVDLCENPLLFVASSIYEYDLPER
jgi:HD-GYP domain-containing protein (c-di-GMP phosphodiesterase class II)